MIKQLLLGFVFAGQMILGWDIEMVLPKLEILKSTEIGIGFCSLFSFFDQFSLSCILYFDREREMALGLEILKNTKIGIRE
ncbi:16547_t:CDS:2, partial [Gigaspora rosea]